MSERVRDLWLDDTGHDAGHDADQAPDSELPGARRAIRLHAIAGGAQIQLAPVPEEASEPVILRVAGRDLPIGRVARLDDVPNPEEFLEALREDAAGAVERVQASIDVVAETQRILQRYGVRIVAELRGTEGATAAEPVIVRVLREDAGVTKAELARRIGHSISTIDRLEAGRPSRVDGRLPYRAAEALGYSPAAIALAANELERVCRLMGASRPEEGAPAQAENDWWAAPRGVGRRCIKCGTEVPDRKGPGRPRLYCVACHPERRRG